MSKRTYYLSTLLLASFVVMLLYIVFQFTPDIALILLSLVFFVVLVRFTISLKRDKDNNDSSNDNKYLPFVLQKNKFLRLVFASLAVSVIISAALAPIFVLILNVESLILYIESYFGYHILGLSIIVSPFVWKFLQD